MVGYTEKTRQNDCSAVAEVIWLSLENRASAASDEAGAVSDIGAVPPHPALIAPPPVLTASAIHTTPSFRYVIRIREPPPFYSRTPTPIVALSESHVYVVHSKTSIQ
jgi:hypothetical protein